MFLSVCKAAQLVALETGTNGEIVMVARISRRARRPRSDRPVAKQIQILALSGKCNGTVYDFSSVPAASQEMSAAVQTTATGRRATTVLPD